MEELLYIDPAVVEFFLAIRVQQTVRDGSVSGILFVVARANGLTTAGNTEIPTFGAAVTLFGGGGGNMKSCNNVL